MAEPWRSQFCELLCRGAMPGERAGPPEDKSRTWVERELDRVVDHQRGLVPLLERYVTGARRVLDVGCGTGASSVALALSPTLSPRELVGVDPDPHACEVATVRASGYGLGRPEVWFETLGPQAPLPFADGSFDLVVCASVLEFVGPQADRARLVAELRRMVRPGGHLYLSTPNPLVRLREQHSGRWLGDLRRQWGQPWANPPWDLERLLTGCPRLPVEDHVLERAFAWLGVPPRPLPPRVVRLVARAASWQEMLVQVP